jgi:hypothetical protein
MDSSDPAGRPQIQKERVTDRSLALLVQGRCLLRLARPTEASPVLQQAREIFGAWGGGAGAHRDRNVSSAGHRAQLPCTAQLLG